MYLFCILYSVFSPTGARAALLPNLISSSSWSELVGYAAGQLVPTAMALVVIMVIYSGFLFVKSQGNEKDLPKAKDALRWAIVGGILLIGAVAIAGGLVSVIRGL